MNSQVKPVLLPIRDVLAKITAQLCDEFGPLNDREMYLVTEAAIRTHLVIALAKPEMRAAILDLAVVESEVADSGWL